MRIGLGTAQFGMDYGITNAHGRVGEYEVGTILDAAEEAGITILDTAHLYGVSEEVLGRFDAGHRFKVVTKTPKGCTADELRSAFHGSLSHLGPVYGLLLHDTADIALWDAMEELKAEGLVEKIGVSIYNSIDIPDHPIDIIQVPFNALDTRLLDGGYLKHLHQKGVEIHARSIFLQGCLLADEPPHLGEFIKQMRGDRDRLEWALGAVFSCPHIDTFLCGVTSVEELTKILVAAEKVKGASMHYIAPPVDERYLNPARWPELV